MNRSGSPIIFEVKSHPVIKVAGGAITYGAWGMLSKFGVTGVACVTDAYKILICIYFLIVARRCAIVGTWCYKRLRCYIHRCFSN